MPPRSKKVLTAEEEEKCFNYWLAGPGIADVLDKKTLVEYLNRVKKMYLDMALEAQSYKQQYLREKEYCNIKDNEIQKLRDLNSDLTKENMDLNAQLDSL